MAGTVIGPNGRIITNSQDTYTLRAADSTLTMTFTASGGCAVTIPAGLPVGYWVEIYQLGASAVSFTAGTGVTLNNLTSQTGTGGQFARVLVKSVDVNVYVLSGDVP